MYARGKRGRDPPFIDEHECVLATPVILILLEKRARQGPARAAYNLADRVFVETRLNTLLHPSLPPIAPGTNRPHRLPCKQGDTLYMAPT